MARERSPPSTRTSPTAAAGACPPCRAPSGAGAAPSPPCRSSASHLARVGRPRDLAVRVELLQLGAVCAERRTPTGSPTPALKGRAPSSSPPPPPRPPPPPLPLAQQASASRSPPEASTPGPVRPVVLERRRRRAHMLTTMPAHAVPELLLACQDSRTGCARRRPSPRASTRRSRCSSAVSPESCCSPCRCRTRPRVSRRRAGRAAPQQRQQRLRVPLPQQRRARPRPPSPLVGASTICSYARRARRRASRDRSRGVRGPAAARMLRAIERRVLMRVHALVNQPYQDDDLPDDMMDDGDDDDEFYGAGRRRRRRGRLRRRRRRRGQLELGRAPRRGCAPSRRSARRTRLFRRGRVGGAAGAPKARAAGGRGGGSAGAERVGGVRLRPLLPHHHSGRCRAPELRHTAPRPACRRVHRRAAALPDADARARARSARPLRRPPRGFTRPACRASRSSSPPSCSPTRGGCTSRRTSSSTTTTICRSGPPTRRRS